MLENEPLISVIVPVYNAQKYISRCLESILSQKYRSIEILIVDDGSVDNSSEICKSFCERDNRCKYIYQNNSGPDTARKEGLQRATGEYVVFVDADDYIKEDMISIMCDVAIKRDADIVCCEIERFNDQGKIWCENARIKNITVYNSIQEKMIAFFEDRVFRGSYWAKLIKKSILMEYGFTEDIVIGEDIAATLYIAEKDVPVVMIPDALYRYYWNTGSISHSGYSERHKTSLHNYIDKCNSLVSKHYIKDESVYGFFAEREMAVATAMSRSRFFDKEAARDLKDHLKSIWKYVMKNKYTALYMKICIAIFIISPRLFCRLYHIVYLITGR